ncbi:OmpA family protein [Flavobacterium wongokense]|uniref:OmpA family protein n=1 Tax=Flavobacterium wongokense TaxID=2910674 RepID=UPI001F3D7A97|nr:OmpA family protein [Flavobacterium sp. WG47]MCF6130742.1 OmpA family protein [Flavobacterium sp. WG47]
MRNNLLIYALLLSIGCFSQNKLEVFFDFNSDSPNEASQIKVNDWMKKNNTVEITKIYGYCDTVDDSKYNKDLAMRRVNSMLGYFKKENFPVAAVVELKSFGKDFKHSKNQNENRKVEVYYNAIKDKKQAQANDGNVIVKDFEYKPLPEAVEEERASLESKFRKSKVGDLIRINNISFHFNSEKLMEESLPLLEELYMIMVENPALVIQINGHICCNQNPNDTKLSYRRALVIHKFLTSRGIQVNRLAFKGYGSNDPIYRLPEKNEKERAANRRVEILIVAKR